MKKRFTSVSFLSKIVYLYFKITKPRKCYSSEESVNKLIKKVSRKEYDMSSLYNLKKDMHESLKIYTMNGDINNLTDKVIIYIHGGTFIEQPIKFQVNFAIDIAKRLNLSLIIPDYKLIPNGNASIMIDEMDNLIRDLKDKEIIFLGDSAGAAFILSYSLHLKDIGINIVSHIIAISPWLDLSLTNEAISKYENKDYISKSFSKDQIKYKLDNILGE